jgi:hypothetical protein
MIGKHKNFGHLPWLGGSIDFQRIRARARARSNLFFFRCFFGDLRAPGQPIEPVHRDVSLRMNCVIPAPN